MKKLFSSVLFLALIIFATSCSNDSEDLISPEAQNQELIDFLAEVSSQSSTAAKDGKGKPDVTPRDQQPPIWADCIEYSGIVVPATFDPANGNFDELYVMPNASFYGGLPLISDSKPGDQDYNGGRWHLNILKEGVDASKYADACYEEALDVNDFNSTDMYFECPLRPRR